MGPHAWISALACVGELGLMLLVVTRGTRSALTLPFVLFTGALFAWNFASLSFELSGVMAWSHLDYVLSPQVAPAVLLFALTFVGRRRELRWLLLTAYGVFSLMSLSAALRWVGLPALSLETWALSHTILIFTIMVIGVKILLTHLRQTVMEAERLHTRILLVAFTLLPILGFTELGNAVFGDVIPRLGSLGTLLTAALTARVALGLDLLGRRRSVALGYGVALGILGVSAYLSLFLSLGPGRALAAFVFLTAALIFVAAARQVTDAVADRRARIAEFATLGRFAAQMAHDLKNPLAALKGATQFLQTEHRRGGDLNPHASMVDLMGEQIDRIQHAIDAYRRLGKVEPVVRPTQLNTLVQRVCALQSVAPPEGVTVRQELTEELPECLVDADLVSNALENLVRNGIQAMPAGGTLTVRTFVGDEPNLVVLTVEDTGVGMDARTRERAFDPFFTTKSGGSGMGLAYVRRVMEAHHGKLALSSRQGQGTALRLTFPRA